VTKDLVRTNLNGRRLLGAVVPLVLAVFAAVGWKHPVFRGLAWACAILFSYDGWGRAVAYGLRASGRRAPTDLGLRLAWGMAACLFVGGVACMVHIASRPFLLGQLALGWCFSGASRMLEPARWPSRRRLTAFVGAPTLILVLVLAGTWVVVEMLHGVSLAWTNMSDDEPLYFFLPQKIVATGTMYDPFDVRRMTSYGGQFFLHAQYLSVGVHRQLNVVDAGIGTFLVMAHVVSEASALRKRRSAVLTGVLAVLLVISIDQVRYNIGSLMTSFAAVLGAHRTWVWIRTSEHRTPLDFGLLALCGVAAFVLRTSCAVPLTLFLALSVGAEALGPLRGISRSRGLLLVTRWGLLGGTFLAALLPWLILFRESTGTLIYPLARGNLTPGFAILKVESGIDYNLTHVLTDVAYPKPFATSIVLLLAALVPATWSRRRATPGTLAADAPLVAGVVIVGLCFTSIMGGAFGDSANARYYFAFLMWGLLVAVWGSSSEPGERGLPGPRLLVATIAIILHVSAVRVVLRDHLIAVVNQVDKAVGESRATAQANRQLDDAYRAAQQSIPAGAGVAATVQDPFRFDLARNSILSLDLLGGMGPAPGFPCFKGPDVLAEYLIANGLEYLVTIDMTLTYKNMELFDLPAWRRHNKLQHSFLNYEAPFVVDGMESIQVLLKTRRVVFKNDLLTVIDLRTLAAEPAVVAPTVPSGTL